MEIDVNKFLREHRATVDQERRLHLRCLCDGTLYFQVVMVQFLAALGCTDIKYDGHEETEGIPEDKPWCSWLYETSGVLPEDILVVDGVLCRKKKEDGGWQNSPMRKWMDEQMTTAEPASAPAAHNDKLFILSETEGRYIDTGYRPKEE